MIQRSRRVAPIRAPDNHFQCEPVWRGRDGTRRFEPRRGAALALAALAATAVIVGPVPAADAAPPPFEPAALAARACRMHPDTSARPAETPPPALTAAIATALADERLTGAGLGLSLWIEGYGEIAAVHADLRLRPASNQKLLTAMGALDVIGSATELETAVLAAGPVQSGTLEGDLYLVGGGDPMLAATGTHSLETLAGAVHDAGIGSVAGDVVADESRYDGRRRANGWSEAVTPAWVGSLSALVVDENRYRADAPFIAEPAASNAALFRAALEGAGVAVTGTGRAGRAPAAATTVATLASPPIRDLVGEMLTESNNTIAELLVKEIGFRSVGVGSTAAGMAALAAAARDLCLPESILQQDGSGLSHGNARSARDWRRLLQTMQAAAWWDEFVGSLAIAGETGTLERRFLDTAATGNLRAKTGTITGVRSLSGLLVTAGGRRVFFSAIVDADAPRAPMAAIDDLLVMIAEDES